MKVTLTKQQIQTFQQEGFLLVEDFLNPEELAFWQTSVTEAIKERAGQKMPGSDVKLGEDDGINEDSDYYNKVFDQMLNLWQTNNKVKQMMTNEPLGKMLAQLADWDGTRIWHDQALIKRPWANPTSWHLDTPFWSFSDRRALSIWVALDDATYQNGCLYFIPGSNQETTFENPGIGKNMDAIFDFYPQFKNTKSAAVPMTPNSAGYETVEVDLSTVSGWNNNLSVTNVRIDPNGGGESGIVSYDYIGFSDDSGSLDLPDSELDDDLDGVTNDVDLCPDSIYPSFVNSSGCFDLPGNNFNIEAIGETCVNEKNGSITISATNTLNYSARLNDSESYDFSSDLTIDNLAPGNYSICITVSEKPDYEQCFNLTIDASEEISGKTVRTKNGATTTETINIASGTAPYTIAINGEPLFSTYERNFSVDVNHGDKISVSSKFECEGILFSNINLIDQFIASPNPTTDYVYILVPSIKKQEISVTVCSLLQQKVSENNYEIQNGRIRVPLNHLPVGLYFVTLNLETPVNFKIMKQ